MPGLIEWVLGALVIIFASTVQATTGFGFGIVSVPLLILIFNPKIAVGLSMLISFSSIIILHLKIKDAIYWKLVKKLFTGALFGLPLGLFIMLKVDVDILKIIISFIIIILSIMLAFNFKLNLNGEDSKSQIGTGSISGIMSSCLGMPGPPVIIFLSNLEIPKNKFRATLTAYFAFIYPVSFILLLVSGAIPTNTFFTALTLIPFTFLGVFIGNRFFKAIPEVRFQKLVLLLLLAVGSYSIISSVTSL